MSSCIEDSRASAHRKRTSAADASNPSIPVTTRAKPAIAAIFTEVRTLQKFFMCSRKCGWLCRLVLALPFRMPPAKPAAVTVSPVPCRVHHAVVSHQQHRVEALGTAQRIDRLARSLRDRAGDVEGGVDGDLDADTAAERLQIGVGEGIIFLAHDLNPPCARSEERRVGKECRSRWSPYH